MEKYVRLLPLDEMIEYQAMSISVFKIAICHTSEGFW